MRGDRPHGARVLGESPGAYCKCGGNPQHGLQVEGTGPKWCFKIHRQKRQTTWSQTSLKETGTYWKVTGHLTGSVATVKRSQPQGQ